MNCDFCENSLNEPVYTPSDTERGAQIVLCESCGLVQTEYSGQKPDRRLVRASSGADWGNIRHGKGLRFDHCKNFLEKYLPLSGMEKVLDIGANRGHFVLWLKDEFNIPEIIALEPDAQVVDDYRDEAKIQFVHDRIESIKPEDKFEAKFTVNTFDLVYLSHTLEHVDSAAGTLKKSYNLLKDQGHCFIDVPNIAAIARRDNVEEFFIDKHSFHFDRNLLRAFCLSLGFKIVFENSEQDDLNIVLILQKIRAANSRNSQVLGDCNSFESNQGLLNNYQKILQDNREKLKVMGAQLNALMQRQKVAFWGGGRIFDSLVKHGDLNTQEIKFVVDAYLSQFVEQVHDIPLVQAKYLTGQDIQVMVLLARSSADEIETQVRRFGIKNIIKYSELMQSISLPDSL